MKDLPTPHPWVDVVAPTAYWRVRWFDGDNEWYRDFSQETTAHAFADRLTYTPRTEAER